MTNNTTAALTDEQRSRIEYALDYMGGSGFAPEADILRALLTSPRAAVPMTDDARECLMDVVSHHDNIVAGFAAQRNAATEADDSGDIAYWNHEINVAHRMQEQAKRALDAAPAAPVDKAEPKPARGRLISSGPFAGRAVVPTAAPAGDEWDASQQAYIESLDEPDQAVDEAEPIDKLEPTLILTGAQLLEALDLVAPDRTADQFESEVSFQYGNGHSGKGMYCWITDYPDEGASLLDGSTVAAQAVAAQAVAADGEAPTGTPFENCQFRNCDLPGQCKAEGKCHHPRAAVSTATADTTWKAPKQHCQNGGDVCLAGNRDGVCCPEDSCDIDDGTRKNPATADERAAWIQRTVLEIADECGISGEALARLAHIVDTRDVALLHKLTTPIVQTLRASQAAAPAEAREPDGWHYRERVNGQWTEWKPCGKSTVERYQHASDMQFAPVYRGGVPADAGEAVALTAAARDVLAERARQM